MPAESHASLIHNDYKYDNVVFKALDAPAVVAVLDWEMATIGDPLMDLGTALAYWIDTDDPEEWRRLGSV
jgi:aminoglycoside phosphotransferase (APT) family kinase protein